MNANAWSIRKMVGRCLLDIHPIQADQLVDLASALGFETAKLGRASKWEFTVEYVRRGLLKSEARPLSLSENFASFS